MKKHILDRLADAGDADKGLRLSRQDVDDLLWEISEMELALELDAAMVRFIMDDQPTTEH